MCSAFRRFERPFLLVTNLPTYRDGAGRYFLERAWHQDFTAHLAYLERLTLASPVLPWSSDLPDLVELAPEQARGLTVLPLPAQTSTFRALLSLPETARRLFYAVRAAEVVQGSVAGWPYPLGWLALALARLCGRKVFVIVESAPWRDYGSRGHGNLKQRVRGVVYELFARAFCQSADLSAYTHPAYRDTLHRGGRGPAYITPATWINDEHVLEHAYAEALWADKLRQPPRFLFAARLHESKGVRVLLDALRELDRRGVGVHVDVVGAGERQSEVQRALGSFRHVELRLLSPVPYGPAFFNLVDDYHAVLAPLLSDEQPRIVFDAYARALPVIASDADGLRPHVVHGRTGLVVPRGDVFALAQALEMAAADVGQLRRMGLEALKGVRPHTHRAMHAHRSQLLAALDVRNMSAVAH